VIAEETRKVVAKDEEEASIKEAEVSEVKGHADAELGKAEPALKAAVREVAKMDVQSLYQLKSVKVPGKALVQILEMVQIILKGPKPKKPNDKKKAEADPLGYFELSQKTLFKEPKKFLTDLQEFNFENQEDAIVEKVRVLYSKTKKEEVAKSTKDLLPVHMWIGASIEYHDVLKIVNPLRETAAEMSAKLDVVQKKLNEQRAKL